MSDVNWNDFTPVDSAPPVDWSQFEEIKPTSAGRKLADLGVSFTGGALGATKAIVDAGGAGSKASQALDSAQETVQSWLSPARQAERANRAQIIREAEKSGSSLQEIGAHLGGIAEAPVSTVAEAAGSVAPIVASMFTPAGRSAAARRLLSVGLGAAQGAGSVKGGVYDAVEKQHLDSGETPEAARQAADQAQAYTGPNTDNIAVGAGLGAIAGSTGVERIVNRSLAGQASTSSLLRRLATGAAGEALPEAAQGGQERYSANVAQQRAGFDVPTWQGVAGQATAEGVAGGMVGGIAGSVEGRHARRIERDAARADALAESQARQRAQDAATSAETLAEEARRADPTSAWTTDLGAADPARVTTTGLPDVRSYGPLIEQAVIPEMQPRFRNLLDSATNANLPEESREAAANELHAVFSPERLEQYRKLQAGSDFTTSPGAVGPQEAGLEFTRDFDTSGLSWVDPVQADAEAAQAERHSIDFAPVDATPAWSTELGAQTERTGLDLSPVEFDTGDLALDTRTPSQRMGIDPAAGPLSRSAAIAVDAASSQQQTLQIDLQNVADQASTASAARQTDEQVSTITPAAQESIEQSRINRAVDAQSAVASQPPPLSEGMPERPANWRTNMLRAGPVAKSLGIDPKGKKRAQVVAEIDALDAQRAGVAQDGADLSSGQIDREWSAFAPETGTLGVPRANMPQIKSEHRGALVIFLKARGIDSQAAEVPANDLKPTQAEFSQAKVNKARSYAGSDRSILVSSDGYVVDGHHQWLAKRANGEAVKVIRLKAPIQQVLAQVQEFPSLGNSAGAMQGDPGQPAPAVQPAVPDADGAGKSAAPVGKEVSRDIGQFKEGMSEFRANQRRNELQRQNPEVAYSAQEDPTLKNGWTVVGRERAEEAAKPATPKHEATQPQVVVKEPSPAPASVMPLDDFGERLEGARKFLPPSIKEELGDDQIASLPLSKIWPSDAHEAMEDESAAALVFAARQEIPAKPRTAYKVRAWVAKVKLFRSLIQDMGGNLDAMERMAREKGARALEPFFAKVRLLAQLPRATWGRVEKVAENPGAFRYEEGERVPSPFSAVTIDGKTHEFRGAGKIGPDEFVKVRELLGQAAPKKGALTSADFDIRRRRDGAVFVNRKGDSEQRPLKEFTGGDAVTQARAWLRDHTNEAEAAWEAIKARDNVGKTDVRREENRARTGADRRNGRDVTPEMFESAFKFRGTQFGNWVAQGAGAKDRQGLLNEAFDALHDLADLLGIPSQAISLNGTLGLSLGARGHGKAAAHFEPSNLVINLTKTKGAGSLAH